jgi:membrane protease YdiL (CAAX protease family)
MGRVFSTPEYVSILLLIPIYAWYRRYRSKQRLSVDITQRNKEKTIFWIFALFGLALSVRIPSVLMFGAAYEKTPLIYLIVLTVLAVENRDLAAFGFKIKNLRRLILYGLAFYIVLGGVTLLGYYLSVSVLTGQALWQSYNVVPFLMTVPFMTMCVGLSEEGFFRGYVQTHVEKTYTPRLAIITQAVLFGGWHFVWDMSPFHALDMAQYVIVTFFIGLLFGYFYARTRNLVPLVIAHGLWNSVPQGAQMSTSVASAIQSMPLMNQILATVLPYSVSMALTFVFVHEFIKRV